MSNPNPQSDIPNPQSKILIGSRGSDLALWQANYAKERLEAQGYEVTIRIIKTQGDRIQHLSFDKMEGKGFFTKELEEALMAHEIDLAVHSYKDLPSEQPEGLAIAGISYREDPSDTLLVHPDAYDPLQPYGLKQGATVGTSSVRRKAQLYLLRPDVQIADLRGNVPTRIQKLRDGQYGAILLAQAGLNRIHADLGTLHVHTFNPTEFVPAPAQGVLAYQVRSSDPVATEAVRSISDQATETINHIEREALRLMEGGCQVPLGIFAREQGGRFHVWCSLAESAESIPRRMYLNTHQVKGLPEMIVTRARASSEASVFITREVGQESLFRRILEARGCRVLGKSLLDIKPLPLPPLPAGDWLFFVSRNGVQSFMEQTIQPLPYRIAALGPGTADALKSFGVIPDFTGTGEPATTASPFIEIAKGSTVIFPAAQHSLRSMPNLLSECCTCIDLPIYSNRPAEGIAVPEADVAVFTSPMNLEAWFSNPPGRKPKHWVAIGTSTAAALEAKGVSPVHTAWQPTELALADVVGGLEV